MRMALISDMQKKSPSANGGRALIIYFQSKSIAI